MWRLLLVCFLAYGGLMAIMLYLRRSGTRRTGGEPTNVDTAWIAADGGAGYVRHAADDDHDAGDGGWADGVGDGGDGGGGDGGGGGD